MMTPRPSGPRRTAVLAAVGSGLVALAACTSSGNGQGTAAPTLGASTGASAGSSGTAVAPATSRTAASSQDPTATGGASDGPGTTTGSAGSSTQSSAPAGGSATSTPRSINGPGGAGSSGSPNGRPSGTAVDAFRAWTADWDGGHYADMYSALPASQQSQVHFRQFAQCQRDAAEQVGASAVVYQRTVRQHRTNMLGRPGTEITASIYFDGFSPVSTQRTLFWYTEGAAWRWALEPDALRSYRHGTCPT